MAIKERGGANKIWTVQEFYWKWSSVEDGVEGGTLVFISCGDQVKRRRGEAPALPEVSSAPVFAVTQQAS